MEDIVRCGWSVKEPIYIDYHDSEWGVPEYDPRALYEKLVLDGFQAGLSWITILKKRDNFRAAWPNLIPLGFDERFRRLWEYYLAYCEAGFLSGNIDVRQVVFAKPA